MQINVEVSDELALRLTPLQDQLPQILELGLREWNGDAQSGFSGIRSILRGKPINDEPQRTQNRY